MNIYGILFFVICVFLPPIINVRLQALPTAPLIETQGTALCTTRFQPGGFKIKSWTPFSLWFLLLTDTRTNTQYVLPRGRAPREDESFLAILSRDRKSVAKISIQAVKKKWWDVGASILLWGAWAMLASQAVRMLFAPSAVEMGAFAYIAAVGTKFGADNYPHGLGFKLLFWGAGLITVTTEILLLMTFLP